MTGVNSLAEVGARPRGCGVAPSTQPVRHAGFKTQGRLKGGSPWSCREVVQTVPAWGSTGGRGPLLRAVYVGPRPERRAVPGLVPASASRPLQPEEAGPRATLRRATPALTSPRTRRPASARGGASGHVTASPGWGGEGRAVTF